MTPIMLGAKEFVNHQTHWSCFALDSACKYFQLNTLVLDPNEYQILDSSYTKLHWLQTIIRHITIAMLVYPIAGMRAVSIHRVQR